MSTYTNLSDMKLDGTIETSLQGLMVGSVSVMPTASEENVGTVVLFTGTTTASYTNGQFYKCTEDDGTYSWVEYSPKGDITVDPTITPGGTNPVEGGAIYTALEGKQDTLVGSGTGQNVKTVNNTSIVGTGNISVQPTLVVGTNLDATPTSESTNPVTSGGVYTAISNAISGVYTVKGSETVANINTRGTNFTVGDVYNMSTAGTLTQGNVTVAIGDNVVWTGPTNGWDKLASDIDLSGYVETSAIVVQMTAQSTDSQIPSAKCVYDALSNANSKITSTTATLLANGWSNKIQAVSVSDLTTTATVLASPSPQGIHDYCDAGIFASAQASGSLTFTCENVPSQDIVVNIVWWEP